MEVQRVFRQQDSTPPELMKTSSLSRLARAHKPVLINRCSSCRSLLSFMFPTRLASLQRSAKLLVWMRLR